MAMSFSRPDPSSPSSIADASFGTARRGFDQAEVKDFLRMVAAEFGRLRERERFLEGELRIAQSSGPIAVDEVEMTRVLGEEAVRVLTTARESAHQIREKAEAAAARLVNEAADDAARVRQEADLESTRRRTDAASDAESELSMAKQQGREMVNEARAYRERVLSELARRRELAREQIEQLIHGRDRLMQSFERARLVAVDVVAEMQPLGEPNEYVNLTPTTGPLPVMIANSPRPVDTTAYTQELVMPSTAELRNIEAEVLSSTDGVEASDSGGGTVYDGADDRLGTEVERDVVHVDDLDSPAVTELGTGVEGSLDDDTESTVDIGADDSVGVADLTVEDDDLGTEAADADVTIEVADIVDSAADETGLTDTELADTDTESADTDLADTELTDVELVDAEPVDTDTELADPDADPDTESTADNDTELADAELADAELADTDTDTAEAALDDTELADAELVETELAETNGEVADDDGSDVVVDLFARLRADSARSAQVDDDSEPADEHDENEPVAAGWKAPESDHAELDNEPELAEPVDVTVEETPFELRDEQITPLIVASARKLKRALADEQNDVLDALRRNDAVHHLDALLPWADEHSRRYSGAIADELVQAVRLGGSSTVSANGQMRKAAVAESVEAADEVLQRWLVVPLRDRLTRCVAEGAGDNAVITKKIRAVYREWKTQRIDETLDDIVRRAHGRGVLAGFEPETPVVWSIDTRFAACPDCEDNLLAGAVASGAPFPTGDVFAPAHQGCRCLLVAVER